VGIRDAQAGAHLVGAARVADGSGLAIAKDRRVAAQQMAFGTVGADLIGPESTDEVGDEGIGSAGASWWW
jgi:hypothetical protein